MRWGGWPKESQLPCTGRETGIVLGAGWGSQHVLLGGLESLTSCSDSITSPDAFRYSHLVPTPWAWRLRVGRLLGHRGLSA